ncbi:endoplasmic reticulum mannosyl-oligosaccharide 1,2-alpha-mannosidase-like [Pollicipes pollicipes]|uniref:endoplasmic reticulum mannosyl-oligosaccharide 1,2-alpha-mannosidase-like n=1 Tax=Pollicipes pollicipes TaxID=41117 RepID=UPI001884BA65|nr:endoplasmic reticulum mannosyl-oligosaccharide 1,2-alpha-mannosidase-like [Pollicipes pollicipes]XP_037079928.1 endoplasmic reticulum mannosyl-oligosaccharide 1,2-alpha-mannosidase-like [Pollicipes pollicipes]XP_037079929.1 endoplasmic reticulum mannosyl-oligosaccharide 1,2-alpha-mannosidase-like [Pollicipes pollicipes]XP_037079930.1 endoplasmic reticulum mannosyl-oligosaccharide 1,2-alpha-mannosidase-like [Pollicipes pollicipes]
MADFGISTLSASQLPLLGTTQTSPRKTIWRRWNQLSRLQKNMACLVLVAVTLVVIYVLSLEHDSSVEQSTSKANDVRDALENVPPALAPDAAKPAEKKLMRRVVGRAYGRGEQHAGPNIEHLRRDALDAAGNKVERVDKVLHLHRVDKVGEEEGDDDPSGARRPPRDPERDDLEPVEVKPEALVPGPAERAALRFPGPSNERQEAVVKAFQHAWQAYSRYAWGHDHLKPISQQPHDWFGLGLTLIDSLDTMYIMNLMDEFHEARDWVAHHMNLDVSDYVNLFETTIRVLGGLLSAHHLSQDDVFLKKAIDLGDRLLPAFETPSGIPFSDVNLMTRRARGPAWNPDSSTAEVATLQLEFNQLSHISGDSKYSDKATAVSRHISGLAKKEGLVPIYISTKDGQFRQYSVVTMGARGDSYYEYLLKQYAQLGQPLAHLRDDFNASVQGIQHLLVKKSKPNELTFLAELMSGGKNIKPKMDHLACFLPGTLALGVRLGLPTSYMKLAEELAHTCYLTYSRQPTGLAPEITYFNMNSDATEDFYVKPLDAHNLLRPETVESLWYLYHLTGNKTYQDWGWNIFQAFEKYTKVPTGGYTSIGNVLDPDNLSPRDSMESFFLGETLKYLYLLFSDDQRTLNLNDFVFNTEAHPLPVLRRPPAPARAPVPRPVVRPGHDYI